MTFEKYFLLHKANINSLVNAEPLCLDLDHIWHVKSHWRFVENNPIFRNAKRVVVTWLHRVGGCTFSNQFNVLE